MTKETVSGTGLTNHPEQRQQMQRKAKLLMVLPLFMLPFLTMAFWALGGGKGTGIGKAHTAIKEGLNTELPSANLKDDSKEDKMGFYERAKELEAKNKELRSADEYFKQDSNELKAVIGNQSPIFDPTPKDPVTGLSASPTLARPIQNKNEDKIMDRLKQLQAQINNPQVPSYRNDTTNPLVTEPDGPTSAAEKLEAMVHSMKQGNSDDPEIQRLEGMLDKILDIQHPERVKTQLEEKSKQQKSSAFPIASNPGNASTSLLVTSSKGKNGQNGFYDGMNPKSGADLNTSVQAVVHETQTIVSGSTLKMRLLDDIYVNGTLIPKGIFIWGTATLSGDRLQIEVTSIRYNTALLPVKLTVVDMDGLAGINVPNGIARDVAKQSADNGLQTLDISTYNPSIGAQAATAGINAAKSLLSHKVKLVKVTVKAGYKILLQNSDNK